MFVLRTVPGMQYNERRVIPYVLSFFLRPSPPLASHSEAQSFTTSVPDHTCSFDKPKHNLPLSAPVRNITAKGQSRQLVCSH